jgi:hypothetical protein
LLHVVVLHRDDGWHLRRQIGVKGCDVDNVVPACACILEYFADAFESAGVGDFQVSFAIANTGNDAR